MRTHLMSVLAVTLLIPPLTSGCREGQSGTAGEVAVAVRSPVPAGTPMTVRLTSTVNSEHARVGDAWSGVLVSAVRSGGRELLPAGATVHGTVTAAREAERGSRAMLDLEVEEVEKDGRRLPLAAATEPVIAGSPRARNLGAIAGGAAAGALIGKAVGGDGKDAAIGGLIGGAAATGAVAKSKGYQVVLKAGTVLEFTVSDAVAMR